MLVLRGLLSVTPGAEIEARAAASELMRACAAEAGTLVYKLAWDAGSSSLIAVEVYRDEAAWLAHANEGDFSRIAAVTSISKVEIYGDVASAEGQSLVDSLGAVTTYPWISIAEGEPRGA